MPQRILLFDEDHVFRARLKASLESARNVEVIGHRADWNVAVELTEALQPDAVLMDVYAWPNRGFETSRTITTSLPELPVVILVSAAPVQDRNTALYAGASGWVSKSSFAQIASLINDLVESPHRKRT